MASSAVTPENLWGKLKEPSKVHLPTTQGEEPSKASIRTCLWEFLERNDIANYPRPVYNRIPNCKGATVAGQKLAALEEFASAKCIEVGPDKAQEEVRYQALLAGKSLVVPTPRLSGGLFNRVCASPGGGNDELRKLASRRGIDTESKPIPMASRFKVDLVVVGSVAVDRRTGRRIGKGEGFADLEWALGASNHGGAVSKNTLVATTVHDCQVFDELPEQLFGDHDLPCDVIVTPTEVIRVSEPSRKPERIIWSLITREKFDRIPVLREVQYKEKRAGNDVRLKDESEDGFERENGDVDERSNKKRGSRKAKPYRRKESEEGDNHSGETDTEHHLAEERAEMSEQVVEDEQAGVNIGERRQRNEVKRNKNRPPGSSSNPHFTVFIGRIPRGSRFKELKEALGEKGYSLSSRGGCSLVWKGGQGFAFLNLDVRQHPDLDVIAQKLSGITLKDVELNVQTDQRNKGGKKQSAGLDNNVDGEDSVKDSKEGEDGSGAIKEKTKSAKNNSKRRNFTKNRQKKDSKSEKDASENGQHDHPSSSQSPSKGKSVERTPSS